VNRHSLNSGSEFIKGEFPFKTTDNQNSHSQHVKDHANHLFSEDKPGIANMTRSAF
jgi:hypothetical protein